jgi:hypothetical protein
VRVKNSCLPGRSSIWQDDRPCPLPGS